MNVRWHPMSRGSPGSKNNRSKNKNKSRKEVKRL